VSDKTDNPELKALKELRAERSEAKRLALKRIDQLSGDSEWSLIQQIAQEIEAYFVAKNERIPSLDDMGDLLLKEIRTKYPEGSGPEYDEVREALIDAIPSRMTIHKWRGKKGWDEGRWSKVRGTGLFTSDKRATLINDLYSQARDGNVTAAKIWLTLSGDYQEKGDTKSDVVEQFREINNILHANKK
jgi:hypothetical protein